MIAADDERHGSYAGAIQHWRAGETACEPCKAAARRDGKRRDLAHLAGRPPMVPLGERAHQIVTSSPRNQMAAATGMSVHRLIRYDRGGPDFVVRRETRARILAFRLVWTPVGIQRRLQALSRLGWSMKVIADETGINLGSLCRLRRNPDVKFVRRTIADAILAAWDRHCDTTAPSSHSSRETVAEAVRRGWLPPAAWEDIDDPDEDPTALEDAGPDEIVVERILAGFRVDCTPAEKAEVYARAAAAGRSLNSLERQMGWNYVRDRKKTPTDTDREVA